ncbi:DUF7669 domain-containing protein [Rummeliibacillus sp. BSL5]
MQDLKNQFKFICDIKPLRDHNGNVESFEVHVENNNIQGLSLNKYGQGPFCKFSIPSDIQQAGLYAIALNNELVYIGVCESLSRRFNKGYGMISPRKCFIGGESNNCRINHLIYEASQVAQEIKLYFLETDNKFSIESALIAKVNPVWNISSETKRSIVLESKKLVSESVKLRKSRQKTNCRDELISAVISLVKDKGKNEFTINEVIEYMNKLNTKYKESTIRTHIASRCCVNAPRHHVTVHNDFRRIGKGVYELHNLEESEF